MFCRQLHFAVVSENKKLEGIQTQRKTSYDLYILEQIDFKKSDFRIRKHFSFPNVVRQWFRR